MERARSALAGPRCRGAVLAGVAVAVLGRIGSDLVAGRTSGPELSEALDVLRAVGAAVLLFVVCGLAPARLLAPPALQPWAPLLPCPLGACGERPGAHVARLPPGSVRR